MDADAKEPERYPIGTVIAINGRYAGFIFAYGSEKDQTYLVNSYGSLCVTNRAKLSHPSVELFWD